jgi:YD repeat-containing protein
LSAAHAANFTRTETYTYNDNKTRWVIGQLASHSVDGISAETISYDAGTAAPVADYVFGKLAHRFTYNADGTIETVTDGNGNVTRYSAWKRGIPQLIEHPDGTSESAIVDGNGWMTQATDENGYATSYSYDSMGRLASISYPAEGTLGWQPTVQSFVQVSTPEYGIPAGHWRQSVNTGNDTKISYYDAMWHPLLVREYDASNASGTQRFMRYAYDHEGRVTFASYPSASSNEIMGVWTAYDVLGRITSRTQDSEQGLLFTLFDYLPGFATRVTDPSGHQTTTTYQVFDSPDSSFPVSISSPEGVETTISRDVFGKPRDITRQNSSGSISLSRQYVYDANQQLCKSIEPETGASAFGYDNAGNQVWSASGLSLGGTNACDNGAAYASGRRVDRTYDSRGRLRTLAFPDGNGDQVFTYTPDGKPSKIVTSDVASATQAVNAYVYNKRRMLTGETSSQVGGYGWSASYDYDGIGNLAGIHYPSGMYVAYAPNALGQPTQAGSYATGVTYYPNGGVHQFTFGNGLTHSVQQNARQLTARIVDSGVIDSMYAYDASGNVARIADGLDTDRTRTMTYDGLNRLTKAVSPSFGGTGSLSYSYDVLGNLLTTVLPGIRQYNYRYDAHNRLTNVADNAGVTLIGFSYDVQGNLANRNGQAFQFDYGNRLRNAAGKEAYRYDGDGRRTVSWSQAGGNIISMYGANGKLWRQDNYRTGQSKEYVYLGNALVAAVSRSLAPLAPSINAPSFSATGSYSIAWNSVSDGDRYELQEHANGAEWSGVYAGSALTRAISGKAAGTYSYRVRACNQGVCGGWSSTANVAVQLPPAAAPSIVVTSASASGSYQVSWGRVATASSYKLEASSNGSSWGQVQASSALSAAFSGMGDGSYSYRVAACNAGGCGPRSAVASVSVRHPPSGAPAISVPSSSGTGSFIVSWGKVANALTYRLEQSTNGSAWVLVYNGAGLALSVSGKPNGTYKYRVTGCNQGGCGGYSSSAIISVNIPPPPPAVPTHLTATYFVTNTFPPWNVRYTISWGAVSGVDSYEVASDRGSYKGPNTTTQIIYVGVPSSAQFKVRACKGTNCSAWSAAVTAVNQ